MSPDINSFGQTDGLGYTGDVESGMRTLVLMKWTDLDLEALWFGEEFAVGAKRVYV